MCSLWHLQEAIWWREETECAIEEEEKKLNEKAASNLRSLLSRIEEGMKKLELQVPEPPTPKPEEEINYNNFAGSRAPVIVADFDFG